jgi:NAD(P)-dependent dehydrogenase (short-subunit alcohol dehydrogenase family)
VALVTGAGNGLGAAVIGLTRQCAVEYARDGGWSAT